MAAPLLIIGAGGQLGTAFTRLFETIPLTRAELDLATASVDEMVSVIRAASPAAVINCAAYTKVDQAEEEEDLATEVNGRAVGRLAEASSALNLPLVTYSTDYVFNGRSRMPYVESDDTDPINAYGRSKLVGERAAYEANPDALVIRTSWVLSPTHRNFVTAILSRAVKGEELRVVNDQQGCPTITDDLARATLDALEAGATGLLHLTNRGATTWFELARTAVERAGLDQTLVTPCPTEEYPTPAPRPAYSVLGSEKAADLGLIHLPHWEDSIDGVVAGSLRLIRDGTP